jgi:hypothetical protein
MTWKATPLYGDLDVKDKTCLELLFLSSFLPDPFVRPPSGAHPFVPTRGSHGRRAQGRSRMAVAPSRPSANAFPGHSLTRPRARRQARERVGIQSVRVREQQVRQDDQRRACLGVAQRSRAPRPCIRQIPRGDLNHDAVMRIGGEAPRRQAHSFFRHRSHGGTTGHCHLGSSWHSSR